MPRHHRRKTGTKPVASSIPITPTKPSDEVKNLPPHGQPGTKYERTFIALKPDAVQRGLIGDVLHRLEAKGFKLVALKMECPTPEKAALHYDDLKQLKFFKGLVQYFSSGPVVAMVWEGLDVILTTRKMLGETKPAASNPVTIRGDTALDVGRNVIHGSDGPKAAEKEIALWFKPSELFAWKSPLQGWIYEG